jgi:transposase
MNNIIGLSGYREKSINYKPQIVEVDLELELRPKSCPCCGATKLHSKGRYERRVRHLTSFGRESLLRIDLQRYRCCECNRTFVPTLPGILPWRQSSEPFREGVYQSHHDGICASTLAQNRDLGQATVGRIYEQFTRRKANERISMDCPQVLGLDEHSLHRGYQMVTTLCDLKRRRVFDLVEGRSARDLHHYLSQLRGREKVKMVCIDLSSPYRRMIKRFFPNARIVADRFHVIRIVQHHFMNLFKQVAPQVVRDRGLLAALRKRPENLTAYQRDRLEALFETHPAIKPLYDKQLQLRALLNIKSQTKRDCRKLAPKLLDQIDQLANTAIEPLQTLAQTLRRWMEPISCMWRFTRRRLP